MPYERAFAIERRLGQVLDLIRSGQHSTPEIAERLGVSIPTISRDVTALRERGHQIRAERHGTSWRYVIGRGVTAATAEPRPVASRRRAS